MRTAFVTGATGLLGNNLVRMLTSRGMRVRALCRSLEKAKSQLGDAENVEIVLAACRTYGEGRFCSKGFPCSGVAHFDKLLKLLRDAEQDC